MYNYVLLLLRWIQFFLDEHYNLVPCKDHVVLVFFKNFFYFSKRLLASLLTTGAGTDPFLIGHGILLLCD